MPTINNASTPVQNINYGTLSPKNSQAADSQLDDSNKIVIEVTPGEDNVDSGDRSQNTAKISITTPNREAEIEVSREQVFNALEIKTKKNAIEQAATGSGGSSPVKTAAVLKSGILDEQNIQDIGYLKLKQNQIETYKTATQNNPYTGETSGQDNSSDSPSPLQQYADAKNAYRKQQFIFSKIDQDISEKI